MTTVALTNISLRINKRIDRYFERCNLRCHPSTNTALSRPHHTQPYHHLYFKPSTKFSSLKSDIVPTKKREHRVTNTMNNRLNGSYPCNPAMKNVERRKTPSCQPHQQVIPHSECPYEGEIRHGQDTGAIGDIAPDLNSRS